MKAREYKEDELEDLMQDLRISAGSPIVDLKVAAKLSQCSVDTIRRAVKLKQLNATKPAGAWRITIRSLAKWILGLRSFF